MNRTLKALEKQTKQALERIPLSPFPSDAVACLFPASAELGQQEELKKTVGLDSKVYVSLSKCFEKWSEMPKLTENFWKELNAWYVSNKEAHCNLQPQQTILAICLRDIEMGNIDAAMCFLKLCRINGSQAYGVMSMGMFKSLFRLLRPAHRAKEDEDEMDQDTKQVDEEDEEENLSSTFDPMLTDLMKEIRLTLFGKDNTRIGSEIGLLNSLAETILTNVLQYKKEHKLSKLFYKHAGKTLKCIVSSATQVLSTGSSGEKENVVTENCADLLVRLLPIVMMVKFGTKGSVVPMEAKETSKIALSWTHDLIQTSPSAGGAFLRRACAIVPIRSEFRKIALKTIMSTLKSLPETIGNDFMKQYLPKYSKASQSTFRLFAVEMCGEIQSQMKNDDHDDEDNEGEIETVLVRTLLERSCDRIPSVRAAALRVLGNIAESIVRNNKLFGSWALALVPALRNSCGGSSNVTPSKKNVSNSGKSLLDILRRRLNDLNSTVKNAALRLMASVPGLLGEKTEVIPTELVRVAAMLATDKAVSTRKRALQLVTALLLRCPSNEEWQTLWLQYVLPGIHDPEMSVQNVCIEAVDRLILAPLSSASSSRRKDLDANSTWTMLRKIPLSAGRQTMMCLQTALRNAPSNRLTPRLLKHLLDVALEMEENVNSGICWALVEELCRTQKLRKHLDLESVVKCFRTTLISIDDEFISNYSFVIPSTQRMLCIMSDASTLLESSRAMELAAMLLQQLTSFAVSGELIHGSVQTIASLCSAHSGPQAVETQRKWCTQVLQRCEEKLTSHLRNVDSDDDTVTRALITLGEVALIYAMGSDAIVKKTVTTTTNKTKTSPPSPCQSGVTYVARVTSVKTVLERLFRPVQAYVAPKQNTPISLSIRAQAFVSFGKLCLCDQSLARRCITVLIRELDTTKEPVLRNNILIILSDLCREHTALVDPYISNMAYCLMDEHAGVRRHALMLITELLLQSFVKLRGPILYLLLGTMLDSDPETAEAAQHAVLEVFSKRDPTLIPTCFVETMFVMNACKDHPKYNVHDDRLQTLLASFYGPGEATLKRRRLYQLMLSSMSNENKIRITARLCQDILGNVVDGVIVLSDHTQAVSSSPVVVPTPGPAAAFEAAAQTMSFEHADFYLIQDTFAILCSDAARVHTTSDGTAQVQQEVIENAEAAASVAKNKLLSKIAHKNALQNVVPCIISLKRQLERIHSPLLKSVMSYFSFLFRFHRRELDNALAEDPTVAAEIQYDLRKMDEQEKKEEEEEEKRRMSLSSKKKKTPGTARSSVRTAKKMKKCLSTSRKDLQRLSVPRVRGTPKNDDEDEEDLSSCVRTLDSALAPLTNQVQTKSLSSPKRRRSLRQKTKSVSSSDEDAPARKKKPVQDC